VDFRNKTIFQKPFQNILAARLVSIGRIKKKTREFHGFCFWQNYLKKKRQVFPI